MAFTAIGSDFAAQNHPQIPNKEAFAGAKAMVIDMTVQQIIAAIIFSAVGAAIVGLIAASVVLARKNLRAPKLTADATLIEKKTANCNSKLQ